MDLKNLGKLQQLAHRMRIECKPKEYVEWRKVERAAVKKLMKNTKGRA